MPANTHVYLHLQPYLFGRARSLPLQNSVLTHYWPFVVSMIFHAMCLRQDVYSLCLCPDICSPLSPCCAMPSLQKPCFHDAPLRLVLPAHWVLIIRGRNFMYIYICTYISSNLFSLTHTDALYRKTREGNAAAKNRHGGSAHFYTIHGAGRFTNICFIFREKQGEFKYLLVPCNS